MTLSLDLLLGFALFALVTSITPGPNNTMLLASGVNFGFNRTIPHMLGITCGFFVLVVAVGFGLGAVFQTYPLLYTVLRYVGAAYLLYLAWKIAHSGPVVGEPSRARRNRSAIWAPRRSNGSIPRPGSWPSVPSALTRRCRAISLM